MPTQQPVKPVLSDSTPKGLGKYYASLAQWYRGLGYIIEFHVFKHIAKEFNHMLGHHRGMRK